MGTQASYSSSLPGPLLGCCPQTLRNGPKTPAFASSCINHPSDFFHSISVCAKAIKIHPLLHTSQDCTLTDSQRVRAGHEAYSSNPLVFTKQSEAKGSPYGQCSFHLTDPGSQFQPPKPVRGRTVQEDAYIGLLK